LRQCDCVEAGYHWIMLMKDVLTPVDCHGGNASRVAESVVALADRRDSPDPAAGVIDVVVNR
jgi:hypothetical protein